MRVYLDLCCLKRPFDDPSQPRIHLESEAVLARLGAPPERVLFLHALAQDLENAQNPIPTRAARVREWLATVAVADLPDAAVLERTTELVELGFRSFDAFHLASAELSGADVLATCDDQFLALARRSAATTKVRVVNPVELVREVFS
jgi:hypothetical protein